MWDSDGVFFFTCNKGIILQLLYADYFIAYAKQDVGVC